MKNLLHSFRALLDRGDYAAKLAQQIEQYRKVSDIHALPDIFHYWSNRHLRPRLNAVMGADSIAEFYARPFVQAAGASGSQRRFLSLGAGDASVEIEVAERMLAMGLREFTLECIEVSPHLLERAAAAIARKDLGRHLILDHQDANRWAPRARYAGVMANHSLHHFVELERIVAALRTCLEPQGCFVSNDMVGRNGHMRWPEVLEFVEAVWAFLPDRYKYQHQLRRLDREFVNWDCSGEGFEGVRAQDILPLLVGTFGFASFLACGGIVDVFVDRGYGHNLDPDAPADRALVDFLQLLDDRLIDAGVTKPTTMFAVMQLEAASPPACWRHWTPRYCVRPVEACPAPE